MSFVAILIALLLEQVRPLTRTNPIHLFLRGWARWVARNFDAGRPQHGWLAWAVAVVGPSAVTALVYWLLAETIGWPIAAVWNIFVLYITLGFRQFSHHFTEIRSALEAGDGERAGQLFANWQQFEIGDTPKAEVVRAVIEYSVIAAHRHVFGVLACFSVFAALGLGPAGAVLYRLSEFVSRYWRYKNRPDWQPLSGALQDVAARAWHAADWLPARITAVGFAVVGSFEEAVQSWRTQEQVGPGDNDGVILAATAGAVNLRIGHCAAELRSVVRRSFMDSVTGDGFPGDGLPGQEPEVGHLRIIVGLVWRTVVMWMILLALLTLARLLG